LSSVFEGAGFVAVREGEYAFEEGNGRAVARFRVLYEDGEGLPAEYGDPVYEVF
jgi:hypothetical protein